MRRKHSGVGKTRQAVKASEEKPRRLTVVIDYPQEGETVRPGHYAVRISAEGAGEVHISIDASGWSPCRESLGYFWFDWNPDAGGARLIAARARAGKGRWTSSEVRACQVLAAVSQEQPA